MTENKSNTISKKLKEYFDRKGLTQQDIADKLGVSQSAVSALLNGKPFGKKLAQKWGDLFEIQPSWLLTGDGEMLKSQQYNAEEPIQEIKDKHANYGLSDRDKLINILLEDRTAKNDQIIALYKDKDTLIKEKTDLMELTIQQAKELERCHARIQQLVEEKKLTAKDALYLLENPGLRSHASNVLR